MTKPVIQDVIGETSATLELGSATCSQCHKWFGEHVNSRSPYNLDEGSTQVGFTVTVSLDHIRIGGINDVGLNEAGMRSESILPWRRQ